MEALPDTGIHPKKAVWTNNRMPRQHRLGQKNVIADPGVMPDDVAAADRHIVADFNEWLDRIIFPDKTVLADLRSRQNNRP